MKRICSAFLAACLCFSSIVTASATSNLDTVIDNTAEYLEKTVTEPAVGSIGGEWAVIGLARSEYDMPQKYWDNYYATAEKYISDCDGVLHTKKYTEYSRVALALTAIGADPTNIGGYNLLTPLGDYDKTIWQGINGPIWALIALDSANYAIPTNTEAKTQATRDMYVQYIIDSQKADGGWALNSAGDSDADITGMALQALANYKTQDEVKSACDKALDYISKTQNTEGGFSSWNSSSVEATVQVIVGLCAMDISLDDARFVKNGNSLLDNLMSYQIDGKGFAHTDDSNKINLMSTEQALYAMVAVSRELGNKSALYNMNDVTITVTNSKLAFGLSGKNADVKKMPVVTEITFPDTDNSEILALSSRQIINGNTDGNFYPDNTMKRAEFATIVVKALGLTPKAVDKFSDVTDKDWFAGYVGTAVTYGIVNGVTDTTFNPNGTITRQEVAVMVARAAKLCGMDTEYDAQTARNILAQFTDYMKLASWANSGVAFCYDTEILDPNAMEIEPNVEMTRIEIAQMTYRLLEKANLL